MPRRTLIAGFFALLLLLMWGATRLELLKGGKFEIIYPGPVSGDEVHYLVALNALLFHHQLELQDTYARAQRGGPEGVGHFLPDHHTILVNRRTGHAASYFSSDPAFAHPSPDVYEVSLHPMAYPLLLAAFLVPFHPAIEHISLDASLVMVLLAWAGSVVIYFIARRIGVSTGLALCAAVVLCLASPWLAYAKGYFSETAAGLFLALSLWAMEARCPKLSALASGIAAAFKPAFAVAGIGFVAERIWARQWREAVEMFVMLAVCGAALLTWNYWLARTFLIPIESTSIYPSGWSSLYDTFFGPRYGLFRFAPWTILAFAFLGASLLHKSTVLRRITIPLVLYTLVLAYVRPHPSACYGPRYWIAFLPWLAIAAVEGTRTARPALRYSFALAVFLSAAVAIPSALRYRELFEQPITAAWLGLW